MKSSALYVMIALSGLVFGAEIVASHITKSLVLLISSYHMLYNIMSLVLLVISRRMSKGKTLKNTFGWARVKVLGMMVNMLALSALCFAAVVEAVQLMVHASHEDTEPRYPLLIICLGVINFCLNILCFFLIGGFTHHQGCYLIIQGTDIQVSYVIAEDEKGDIRSSFQVNSTHHAEDGDINHQPEASSSSSTINDHRVLDISRDISSCLPVIACGAIVYLMEGLLLKYIDSMLAFASVIVLLATTYPFIRESSLILLQSIPKYIDVNGLTIRMLKQFPAIENVHDLHIWRLTASEVIATVHIMLQSPFIYTSIADPLTHFFKKEGIGLVTIQPEFSEEEWCKIPLCYVRPGTGCINFTPNYFCPNRSRWTKTILIKRCVEMPGAFLDSKTECILKCSDNNNCDAMTCCGPLQSEKDKTEVRHRAVPNKEIKQNGGSVLVDLGASGDKNLLNTSSESNQDCDLPLIPKYDFERILLAPETKV